MQFIDFLNEFDAMMYFLAAILSRFFLQICTYTHKEWTSFFFLHAGLLIWGCGRARAYNTAFLLDICSLLQELRSGWPWRHGEARAHLAPGLFRLWTLNSHAVWNVLLWRFILIPMCLHSLRKAGNEATHCMFPKCIASFPGSPEREYVSLGEPGIFLRKQA